MRFFASHTELDTALDKLPLDAGAFRFAPAFAPAFFRCSACGLDKPLNCEGITTGYGRSADTEELICFDCCGVQDREQMLRDGRGTLYLTTAPQAFKFSTFADGRLTNWPGTVSIPCRVKRGLHNIARHRYDVWFSFEGANWHGTQYGDFTQICRVKRLAD
jgi:hypothetical protein